MIELLTLALGKLAEAFLAALADKVTHEVLIKLQGDPAKATLKQALGKAVWLYSALPLRLDIARPLLAENSFLTQPAIAQELTQLVRFEREPNAELIGKAWKAELDDSPSWCDFTDEAKTLLKYVQKELRDTPIFQPVFDSRSLDAIALGVTTSAESLTHVESQLADLTQLWTTGFNDFLRAVSGASFDIRSHIRDYSRYISEKTHDFVGRQIVFEAITHFTETHPRGYFFVQGDPGIGKSALAAQLVKTHAYVHHFNIRSNGINKADTFLRNICAQLIVIYKLDHTFLPPETTQDSGFLEQLLDEISRKLRSGERAIILIDALDEVDTSTMPDGVNSLYLPSILPLGIFFVITTRRGSINLRIECEQDKFEIKHDSTSNMADIHAYIEQATAWPGIQTYISKQEIDNELFVEHLLEKSEGNFMYLRYVLPEIECGAYTDLGLDALPAGLQNYYEDHWRRMRGKNEEEWFAYKLPIIMALTVVKQPVSIDLIANFSGVRNRVRILDTLHEWEPFLHEEVVAEDDNLPKRYSVYHASFHDFIARMEEVHEEQVSRQGAHKKIVDSLWEDLFGDEKST